VVLAVIRQEKTICLFASQFKVHPTMIGKWKSHLLEHCEDVFRDGRQCTKKEHPSAE
jgi:hypothetical protein